LLYFFNHEIRLRKKSQRQGAQSTRNETYFYVRRNDEGCSVRSIWTFSEVVRKGKGGLVRASFNLKSEGLSPSWFVLLPANHARYF
jgi:hypothetical protein